MGFTLQTNTITGQALRNVDAAQAKLDSSIEKLSSGKRINQSGDDAAGLAQKQGLWSQVTGSQVASRNAQDGVSLMQTADGALAQVQSILRRLRDLAVEAANDTQNDSSRNDIQTEASTLTSELGRIIESTNVNGVYPLVKPPTPPVDISFQVGARAQSSSQIVVSQQSVDPSAIAFDGSDSQAAAATIGRIDGVINAIASTQAVVGATENRFGDVVLNLQTAYVNMSAANSRIEDTDMASAVADEARASVLVQAGQSVVAQANHSQDAILKLLGQ